MVNILIFNEMGQQVAVGWALPTLLAKELFHIENTKIQL